MKDKKNKKVSGNLKTKNKKSDVKKDKVKKCKTCKGNKNKKNNLFSKLKVKFSFFKKSDNLNYSFKEVIVIMFFSLGLGFVTCLSFTAIFYKSKDYKVLSKDLGKFVETYNAIKKNYYGEFDVDYVVDSAIKGMVSAVGDVYTSYTDDVTADDFMQTVTGVYEGIGCTVSMNLSNQIVIVDMFEGSPSLKAGLKVGDIILKVDDVDYSDKTSNDMSNYVKNSNKSEVKLTILRDEVEQDIVIKREKIEIPYVTGEVITRDDKKIGYINISLFSSVTDQQFEDKLKELEKEGIDSLVIDVRGNNGGYLSSVTDIINLFLEKNDIMYQLKDKNGITLKKDTTKEKRKYPVAVLINGASASASEILAAAIKESYGGFVVGTNSYGKGTVQQTTTLTDGSMIKYTVQNWLTPDGNWINEVGVEPTDVIEMNSSYIDNPTIENDNQLNKAIELLINKKVSN